MTGCATFCLDGSVLEDERPLLVCVALHAGRIRARRQSRLLGLESAVRVMAIAATHGPFEHLVMERLIELMFDFGVTLQAELRLALPQELNRREAGLLSVSGRDEDVRFRTVYARVSAVRRVAIGATDIIAPMLAASEVVVFLFAGMACEAGLRNLLRGLTLESANLGLVAVRLDVRAARAMTGFTAAHTVLPARLFFELGVRGLGKIVELLFVAGPAGLCADVIVRVVLGCCCCCRRLIGLLGFVRLRKGAGGPQEDT